MTRPRNFLLPVTLAAVAAMPGLGQATEAKRKTK
jgi:hypothetical protein